MKQCFPILLAALTVFTGHTQNIGIGTNIPHQSSILHLHSTTRGFLPPRMTNEQRSSIVNPLNGLMVYDTDAERLYVHTDGEWKLTLNSDYWGRSATRNWVYNGTDSIGIGTAAPSARLHVNGMLRVSNNELMLSGSDMTINKSDGIIQFQSAADNIGFMQLSGNNLRLGTNSGNTTGNVVFRLNGTDRVFIDELGRVGLGIAASNARLNINGDIQVSGPANISGNASFGGNINLTSHLVIGGNISMDDINRISKPMTGAFDLLPIAYGRVRFMVAGVRVTDNVTVTRLGIGIYNISCPQFNATTTIVVTMNEYQGSLYAYPNVENLPQGSTNYQIRFYNTQGELLDAGFSFIAYR